MDTYAIVVKTGVKVKVCFKRTQFGIFWVCGDLHYRASELVFCE